MLKSEEGLKKDADKALIWYAREIMKLQYAGKRMEADKLQFGEFKEVYEALKAFGLADCDGYDRYFNEAKICLLKDSEIVPR